VTTIESTIEANYRSIRQRIEAACARVERDPASVTLVAVTKYAQLDGAVSRRAEVVELARPVPSNWSSGRKRFPPPCTGT